MANFTRGKTFVTSSPCKIQFSAILIKTNSTIIQLLLFTGSILKNGLSGILQALVNDLNQGPVVQSIVSLTSSLRGQLVKCFMTI